MKIYRNRPRVSFNAPAVLCFAGLCLIATVLGLVTHDVSTDLLFSTCRAPFSSPLTYVRLFGHVLGHADWSHLFNNMMYVLLLGPMLEEKYGWKSIVLLIAVTAVITGVFNMIFFPFTGLCGASGVVFAMILLSSITRLREGEIPLTFILVALLYLGEQLIQAFTIVDNVSQTSHIIGGVTGAAFGFWMNRRRIKR